MKVGDLRVPQVLVTYASRPLAEAARMMRDKRVGALVVLDPLDPERRPQGMLTDRDIVRGQISKGADLYCLTVGDVMSPHPLCLALGTDLGEAIEALNSRAVRRAPIVDGNGTLAGIVTLDDLVPAIARELQELAQLMGSQTHGGDRATSRSSGTQRSRTASE
jgi:CBS domain-containing protein